jgi:hypothetical protein
MTMPSPAYRLCPLCRKPTPARYHLPPGACVARHDPVFCPECWPARRDEIARLLLLVVGAYRARAVHAPVPAQSPGRD